MFKIAATTLVVSAALISANTPSTKSNTSAPGVTKTTVQLGQSCALKGPATGLGKSMKAGLDVYFEQINKSGGVDGRTIKLKSINDGYEPEKTEFVTKTLIDKVNAFLLIGEVGTPTSKVAVPICEEKEVPFIAPFTGAEFLRNPYKKWVVNVRASYYQEMERHMEYMVDELGFERIACFYQNDGYGRAGLAGVELALERRGMTLVSTGTYEPDTVAIKTGLDELAAGEPQGIVVVGAYKPCAAFIKAAKQHSGTKDAIFGNLSFVGTMNLLEELGGASEGCVVTQVVPFPWDTSVGIVDEYTTAMKAAGRADEIGFISLEGFMAAKFFCMALDATEEPVTREGFIEAINTVGTFDLGDITLEFGPDDHQGLEEVYMTVFKSGEVQPLTW